MHKEEITIDGHHVTVHPDWVRLVELEMSGLEKRHPGAWTRVAVRFAPIKPHHRGMTVSLNGRVNLKEFHVEEEGDDVLKVLRQAFRVAERSIGRTHTPHPPEAELTEMAEAEALAEAQEGLPVEP